MLDSCAPRYASGPSGDFAARVNGKEIPMSEFWSRILGLWGREKKDSDLNDEVRAHLDLLAAENVRRGMDPEEARYAARREFGGVEQVKEIYRERRGLPMIETFLNDIRFGARILRKNPGFTAIAILTLALGVGANSAIFTVVNSMLLRPLAVKDPGQITVLAFQHGPGNSTMSVSYPEYEHIRQQAESPFSDVIGWELGSAGLRVDNKNYALIMNYVPGNFFDVLGIQPAHGRLFFPSEGKTPGADPIVVLGYAFWYARLGADPNIVGSKVMLNGHPFTVAGIAPKDFHGLAPFLDMQAYVPFAMYVTVGGPPDLLTNTKNDNLHLLGRLRQGVTFSQASAALSLEANRLAQQFPETDKNLVVHVFPELRTRPDPESSAGIVLASRLFLALAALVLVLACVNVANLLLVRATTRNREMAIRTAMGGTRARLIRLLLTESVLLALAGGAAGVLLGKWGSHAISSVNLHTTLPLAIDFSFDWRVFTYSFLAALFTGVLVGIVPAVRASRANLMDVLRESGRTVALGRHRFRNSLVTVQIAGSLMLLVVAMLFTRSMAKAQHVDLGFQPEGLVNMTMDPTGIGYTHEQSAQFFDQLIQRVRALPGVNSASIAFAVPMGYYNSVTTLDIDGYQPPPSEGAPMLYDNVVSPGYFQNMRIPVERGRDFTDGDKKDTQAVAVVNEAMARKFWPGRDAIGRHFKMRSDKQQRSIEIVGIARDSRYDDLSGNIAPFLYVPFSQHDTFPLRTLQIRSTGNLDSVISSVQKTIADMAPALPVFNVQTMSEGLNTINGVLTYELGAAVAACMGILGLILAIVGVYGVVSYATNQRTHEIGIRVALGAQSDQIVKLVLKQGLHVVSIGIGIGLLCALAAGRVVGQFLVGVGAADPLTFISVSLILAAVSLFACWIPARRAVRVDPAVALRHD
jgi:predicted permease